ncbi:MAG: hypothetical protein M0P70_13480 [Desulfobulbaceae bacterium]|nr:hypothetical protein [Desulfobulbaceae bacterium]
MLHERIRKVRGLLTVLLFAVALIVAGCAATGQSGQLADGSMLVKGKVSGISQADKTLTIKPRKGDKITVTFNEKTALQGYSSAELIEKNQPVEVTYRPEENANLALTIKQLPEGACQ